MTVARQICILEYGSHFHVNELKRTQTKTGVSEVGEVQANVNAAKSEFKNALFFSEKRKLICC